jgi:hypothetical protein
VSTPLLPLFNVALASLFCVAAMAQEQPAVSFDLGETGGFVWQDFLIVIPMGIVWYMAWRWFTKFIEKRRARIPWKSLSYALPSAILVIDGVVGLASTAHVQNSTLESVVEVIAITIAWLNLPVLPLLLVVLPWLEVWPMWLRLSVLATCIWGSLHFCLRLLHRRAWRDVPVTLFPAEPRRS